MSYSIRIQISSVVEMDETSISISAECCSWSSQSPTCLGLLSADARLRKFVSSARVTRESGGFNATCRVIWMTLIVPLSVDVLGHRQTRYECACVWSCSLNYSPKAWNTDYAVQYKIQYNIKWSKSKKIPSHFRYVVRAESSIHILNCLTIKNWDHTAVVYALRWQKCTKQFICNTQLFVQKFVTCHYIILHL